MRAYKATNKNLQCRGYQFALGETFTQDGEIIICVPCFHACQNPADCFEYYTWDSCRLFEVEILGGLGDAVKGWDKLCTGKLRFVREIDLHKIYELPTVKKAQKARELKAREAVELAAREAWEAAREAWEAAREAWWAWKTEINKQIFLLYP